MRVSGPRCKALARRLFSKKRLRPRVATYGTVLDPDGAAIDRALAIFMPAPRSDTGEDTLEFQVHGSPIVAREVTAALLACGARLAGAGEFTKRAVLNGKLDLHAAQAVADLIDAQTRSAARAALANLGGGLAGCVRRLRSRLCEQLEQLAAAVDFPDEVNEPDGAVLLAELEQIAGALRALQRDGETGRLVREGVTAAIVGPPNAGKSSLLNALLGEERAIVAQTPGTTRDTVEETIALDGMSVRLVDTAGIRAHAGSIEGAGIERTFRALESSRMAIVVLDASLRPTQDVYDLLARAANRPRVVFANKVDLGRTALESLNGAVDVAGSVFDPSTIETLRAAIARAAWGGESVDVERPHLAALHELDAVTQALDALDRALQTLRSGEPLDFITGELQSANASLGHICEDAASAELLERIFSRFCIGK